MKKGGGVPVPVNLTSTMLASIDASADIMLSKLKSLTPSRTGLMRLLCRHVGGFTGPLGAKRTVGWVSTDFTSRLDKNGRPLPFYPVYVGEGTGRYRARSGIKVNLPVGRPAKGTNKYIRYEYAGGWVSLKSVKGQKPQHMIERAMTAAGPLIMALIDSSVMNVKMAKVGG